MDALLTAQPNARLLITAPGRVNLLGEHVDYNDGCVLPAAIDRSVRLAAAPISGLQAGITALDLDQRVTLDLSHLEDKTDAAGNPLPDWALYPAGVAWALQKNGLPTPGFQGSFTSNVPIGSGLSSSAAVEVAFAALFERLGGWSLDRVTLARYCQQAENHYVGVNSGLMDQFASANGVAGHALLFNTRTLHFEPVPLPADVVIIIADSRMRRSLANSAYNDRRAACEKAVGLLQPLLPGIQALCDITPGQFNQHSHLLPEVIEKRARHVVEECDRVQRAEELLKAGRAEEFGQLMYATHASLRDLYEVSIPELDALVEIAAALPGCLGARLTGAGFGGCTVNLVREEYAADFMEGLRHGYDRRTGRQAEVYLCHASDGVRVTDIQNTIQG